MEIEKFYYDNKLVKYFAIATIVWGLIGMSVGLFAAIQLVLPDLNHAPSANFGRLRPVHTNTVIFAFVGNGIFMGVYYSIQRLCKARIYSYLLGKIHFVLWQVIILLGIISLLLGYTTGKEYAEFEWPLDIATTICWVTFGINLFGTIINRREKHLYVAIWFYIATFITVAILHIVNSLEIPVSLTKSYSIYSGVQDALVQWWYGHNAVAFILTTPYLGLMYYFLPKAANRPIYSYKLSIIHFWALIFIYIWAGPHHLLYTALPDWVQSLGTAFSIMLIAPSWGGMLNGLLTLRGAWDKVREEPILKFFVIALTAYGMATFEGPMLALKNVNAISHFTDWTVSHVHLGTLGWNGFLTFGAIYWIFPKIYKTELYSKNLANWHFWIGTLGIIFYIIPLYWAGFTQSLMWKEFTEEGLLRYPNFLETVQRIIPMYAMRVLGGTLYLSGVFLMIYNIYQTTRKGSFLAKEEANFAPIIEERNHNSEYWHRILERKPFLLLVVSTIVVSIGSLIEMIPTFLIKSNIPTISSVKPLTPLELEGRDIYVREGCFNCHSQMVRPFRDEVVRYGEYAKAGEFVYDHPFQWGSKRTGPDLLRVGAKYTDSWHYNHMMDPTSMSPGSIMPKYHFLLENTLDTTNTVNKITAMRSLGVPYDEDYELLALEDLENQASKISENLKKDGINSKSDKEIIALIAYLQRLGVDIKGK